MNPQALDFVLDRLTPDEQAALQAACLSDRALVQEIAVLRRGVDCLARDATPVEPPARLMQSTLQKVLAKWPRTYPMWQSAREYTLPVWLRRADTIVAASIGFLVMGLCLAAIGKVRAEREALACQDRLRRIHLALSSYADTHDDRLPMIGSPGIPVAGAFHQELVRTGHFPASLTALCPGAPESTQPVSFTYNLGYTSFNGTLHGLRRGDHADITPVSSDLPSEDQRTLHSRGQNLLSLGGFVRVMMNPVFGTTGDDIFRNQHGVVRAGLHRNDVVLGCPSDYP